MIIGFTIMSPEFLTVGNALNILLDSSVLMILALASTIIILMGSIDLSIGSTLALCAFSGALLAQQTGDNNVLLLVPVVGLVCGLLNGLGIAFLRLPSFLVTLGSYFVYNGLANYFSGGQPVTLPSGGPLAWFSGTVGGFPVIALWAIVVLAIVYLVFRYTKGGRYVYAIGGNEKTARLAGAPVRRVKVWAFAAAGTLAGLAALLQLAKLQSASPEMGAPYMLPAIAAVVMGGTPLTGGIGGALRTVVGVLVIAILSNGMVLGAINPHLQNVIQGLVVVAAVAVTMDRRRADVVK
jgi:ribose transport system permease protein/putative xylitol transport system permease protein